MSDMPALLVFGAHPDDCELTAGGLASLYSARGGRVRFVALTNGDAGHQTMGGGLLARTRRAEAGAAAKAVGGDSIVLDNHDGELMPTLENRRQIIAIIREFKPDLLLLPRPNDYHPDHRYTSVLVQDASYMVTVPNIAAFAERVETDPVVMYVSDRFQKPYPFQPDVVIDTTDVVHKKVEALHCHTSQMYDWLPWHDGGLDTVPADDAGRLAWLRERYETRLRTDASRFRDALIAKYGQDRGSAILYAEAFEACEYGSPLSDDARARLFPF